MTKAQLQAALTLAQSNQSLDAHATNIFDGYALPHFAPVVCTLEQLAWLVRWQVVQLNGAVDGDALNELHDAGRHHFSVLESPLSSPA